MRFFLFILFLGFTTPTIAQLREGFDPDEAKSLIAICNSYTFLELYGSDTLIVPEHYRKVFTSEENGLDNMFQVYESNNVGVINFRGTTTKTSSWVENIYSAMIPAEGVIKINNEDCSYKFAEDTSAAVHAGYALAVVLFSPQLLEQINMLNGQGIYHILLTGHSQGGALAHLVRAYLANQPEGTISSENVFKTYAFANPMIGNQEFALEYMRRYSEINMSYSIINPADIIPKMPMHYLEEGDDIDTYFQQNPATGLDRLAPKNLKNRVLQIFEPLLTKYITSSNKLIEKVVSKSIVSFEMPPYVEDINYFQTGAIRKLTPFLIPKIPVDTVNMAKKEIAKLKKDKDGNYYHDISSMFQHKPYNYYVAILKEYFSKDYRELELLYLPEGI